MKKGANIWTLKDIANGGGFQEGTISPKAASQSMQHYGDSENSRRNSQHTTNPQLSPQCLHITTLPNPDAAKSLLEQVVREFAPIVSRRGYNVRTVSEMCCCGDGLTKRRGGRLMGSNIWGYNQTHTMSSSDTKYHEIHLRLRHAKMHTRLHDYEDVAGTLAHELAHCEHGPHNQHFYKLMDEILDEHAGLMSSGLAALHQKNSTSAAFGGQALGRNGADTMASGVFGGEGQVLGGKAVAASRLLVSGRCLGGDKVFAQWMNPVEAAVAAAESRRRQAQMRLRAGDHCCVIEILDDDGDEPHNSSTNASSNKSTLTNRPNDPKENGESSISTGPTVKKQKGPASAIIDLTCGDEDDGNTDDQQRQPNIDWSCHRCTFRNLQASWVCGMCSVQANT
jgi:DNA-dependent metalloprotease WSS1